MRCPHPTKNWLIKILAVIPYVAAAHSMAPPRLPHASPWQRNNRVTLLMQRTCWWRTVSPRIQATHTSLETAAHATQLLMTHHMSRIQATHKAPYPNHHSSVQWDPHAQVKTYPAQGWFKCPPKIGGVVRSHWLNRSRTDPTFVDPNPGWDFDRRQTTTNSIIDEIIELLIASLNITRYHW